MDNIKRTLHWIFTVSSQLLFTVVALPILYLLEPFIKIRIGILNESQIGMLAIVTDLFCRRLKLNGVPPRTKFVFLAWNPANRQLLNMWKRHLSIIENKVLRAASEASLPILKRTRFYVHMPYFHTEHIEMTKAASTLSFTRVEEEVGRHTLEKMGIGPNDWFVCFHARDRAYKAKREGFGHTYDGLNIRDTNITNFIPAIRWIADQGGIALRMGKIVEAPLPDLGPRIIDYATKHRTDFMDVFLAGKCRFFLSSDSGTYCPSLCFDVPVACTNMAGFCDVALGQRMMYIPKLLRWKKEGRLLTIPEVKELGLFDVPIQEQKILYSVELYDRLGLEWVENSADEILGLCLDMVDHLEGRQPPTEARRLQALYKSYYTGAHSSPYAGPIGPRFAMKHSALIEPSNWRPANSA